MRRVFGQELTSSLSSANSRYTPERAIRNVEMSCPAESGFGERVSLVSVMLLAISSSIFLEKPGFGFVRLAPFGPGAVESRVYSSKWSLREVLGDDVC